MISSKKVRKSNQTILEKIQTSQNPVDQSTKQESPINIEKKTIKMNLIKDKNEKSCYDKFASSVVHTLETLPMQIVILILSVFALLNDDIRLVLLPKNVDKTFEKLNEIVFCILFFEFLIFCILRKRFIFSFYFWLDILSLLSLLPEVHFIWIPLTKAMMDADQTTGIVVLQTSSMAKASETGAKASKYIKLMKLLSFIKIIRVAKVVETSKKISSKSVVLQRKVLNFKHKNPSLLHLLKRRKNLLISSNTDEEKLKDVIKLSMRYTLSSMQEGMKSKLKELERQKTKNKKKFKIESLNKNEERKDYSINTYTAFYAVKPIKEDDLEAQKSDQEENEDFSFANSQMKNENLDSSSKNSDEMDMDEERELENKVNENKIILKKFNNPQKTLTKKYSMKNKIINDVSDERLNDDALKNNGLSSSERELKHNNKGSNDRQLVNTEYNNLALDLNKPSIDIDNHHKNESQGKKESEHHSLEHFDSEEEENNISPDKMTTNSLLENSNHFKLFRNLTETINHIIVIIVMALLISLPIVDEDFFSTFLFSPNQLISKEKFCLSLISKFILASKNDTLYLNGLNRTINRCTYEWSGLSNDTRFVNLNFSESADYYSIKNLDSYFNLPLFIQSMNSTNFLLTYRIGLDYYNMSYGNEISSTIDQSPINRLTSIFSIVKSFFVAGVLITISYLLNQDVINYVIFPLNVLIEKLKFYLDNCNQIDYSMELVTQDDILKDEQTVRKKKKIEIYIIEQTLKKFVNLISLSLGKQMLMIIPNFNIYQQVFTFNTSLPGIQYEGSFIYIMIHNQDDFVATFKEKALVILNKIYTIFHTIGLLYLGEPIMGGEVILWRNNHQEYLNKVKTYSSNLIDYKLISEEIKSINQDIQNKNVNKMEQHNTSLCLYAAIKMIISIYRQLSQTTKQILRDFNLNISIFIDYGTIFQGYHKSSEKIDSIYAGMKLQEAKKILGKLNNYNRPSIFISNDAYDRMNMNLKKAIYPFEIIKMGNQKIKIYKQFINFTLLDLYRSEVDVCVNKKVFYEKRREVEMNILNNEDFSFEELLYIDDDYKETVDDFPMRVKFLLIYVMNKIYNYDYIKSINALEDAKSFITSSSGTCLIQHINRLLLLIEEYVMSEQEFDYTLVL